VRRLNRTQAERLSRVNPSGFAEYQEHRRRKARFLWMARSLARQRALSPQVIGRLSLRDQPLIFRSDVPATRPITREDLRHPVD
jgi:hypothetical protein